MGFAVDGTAFFLVLAIGAVALLVWLKLRSSSPPHLFFSHLSDLERKKRRFSELPRLLEYGALTLMVLAFMDPHLLIERGNTADTTSITPTEGIAIYLVLDHSGSMAEKIKTTSLEGKRVEISKLYLLKQVTEKFVHGNKKLGLQGRSNDLIGIVEFARSAQVMAPLTLDHQAISKGLEELHVVRERSQDGTAIGYAIFKTVNLIAATRQYAKDLIGKGKPAYDIKSSIIVLVTDGLQDPNPLDKGNRLRTMDLEDAAAYAIEHDVKVYLINVDPKIATEPFVPHRRLMQRITESTGGEFYMATNPYALSKVYSTIDVLEKSLLPQEQLSLLKIPKDKQPHRYRRVSFYPTLVVIGMLCFFVAVFLRATFFREVP